MMTEHEFTITRAGVSALELAVEAVRDVHERDVPDEGALEEFLSDNARYLLLAVESGRVVGSLNGYALRHPNRREPAFLLYEIDVREECRNRGIGKALVNRFVAEARSAGAFEVWVVTNQSNGPAMAMYRHCGLTRPNPDDVMLEMTFD
jgi:ribosomal protein S18 acetylase RimI-like enzyme